MLRFLLVCLCALCLVSCDYQKYNEGPVFSIYPTEDRLANTWQWQLAVKDDVPLTGVYADSTISFDVSGTVRICDLEENCRNGSWSLVSKRTRLQMIFGRQTSLFDIQMLKKDEVWLQQSTNGNLTVEWELIPAE